MLSLLDISVFYDRYRKNEYFDLEMLRSDIIKKLDMDDVCDTYRHVVYDTYKHIAKIGNNVVSENGKRFGEHLEIVLKINEFDNKELEEIVMYLASYIHKSGNAGVDYDFCLLFANKENENEARNFLLDICYMISERRNLKNIYIKEV